MTAQKGLYPKKWCACVNSPRPRGLALVPVREQLHLWQALLLSGKMDYELPFPWELTWLVWIIGTSAAAWDSTWVPQRDRLHLPSPPVNHLALIAARIYQSVAPARTMAARATMRMKTWSMSRWNSGSRQPHWHTRAPASICDWAVCVGTSGQSLCLWWFRI